MLDAGVLSAFRGVAVHDGWAPYRSFTDALHALCALCGAHHLRELTAAEQQGQLWVLGMSCLVLAGEGRPSGPSSTSKSLISRSERTRWDRFELPFSIVPRDAAEPGNVENGNVAIPNGQRATRRRGRVRPASTSSPAHRSISLRNQSFGRPRPRSRTGRGMSVYRRWYGRQSGRRAHWRRHLTRRRPMTGDPFRPGTMGTCVLFHVLLDDRCART